MASSLISNIVQVNFDSVLGMEDEGMVAMFEALVSSGLSGFLGCSSAIYKAALVEFFQNATMRDDKVVNGLIDMGDVSKDLMFDARSDFSFDGQQIKTSCKKREMKFEVRLLNDILANTIMVKAGSFDAVTHEWFVLMAAIHGGRRLIVETDVADPVAIRSDDIAIEDTGRSIAVNDEDDNLDGAENEIARKMAYFTRLAITSEIAPFCIFLNISDLNIVLFFYFEEKADIEGIQMSPSVSSVPGVSTSSFGLVETTAFGLEKKTQLKLCRDTLVTVHQTLSSPIADGRLLRIGLLSVLGFNPMSLWGLYFFLYVVSGYHGFSAGRGVDPAGGAPGGGEPADDFIPTDVRFVSVGIRAVVLVGYYPAAWSSEFALPVFDWAVKMRIRPPELETSICDVKYHVSLSTGCVLGKWVCLVTLAMSLFDLQDVCIVIGSLATLDLPMIVDLIGIYLVERTILYANHDQLVLAGTFWKLSRSVRSDRRSEL
ncbi:splicing factor 3B subunit 1 [Dorcoceras hygrometricum]|uniref:Splicing factor 3B subunit 1 n=1 Tax=Dorcoceras hygrometricum TaxID=472368 RepID=A0A2Z7CAF2_9LAMI|nr:splicing factor 3B subunit 1 [Dorcoceras hygrometricum]